jgi:hypothetical protein
MMPRQEAEMTAQTLGRAIAYVLVGGAATAATGAVMFSLMESTSAWHQGGLFCALLICAYGLFVVIKLFTKPPSGDGHEAEDGKAAE